MRHTLKIMVSKERPNGGVIACIMAQLFPEENKNRYQWQPEPGHGYAVYETEYERIP